MHASLYEKMDVSVLAVCAYGQTDCLTDIVTPSKLLLCITLLFDKQWMANAKSSASILQKKENVIETAKRPWKLKILRHVQLR